jgi:hypothetical protein
LQAEVAVAQVHHAAIDACTGAPRGGQSGGRGNGWDFLHAL